jgi:hypothetical protein
MRSEQALDAQRYREKAQHLRLNAGSFADEKMRQQILDIAAQYDQLAETLEGELRRTGLLRSN